MRNLAAILVLLAALLAAPEGRALSPEEARHLVSRAGFGAAPAEIDELAPLAREQAVDLLLSRMRSAPVLPRPAFLDAPWPPYRDMYSRMGQGERDAFIQARRAELQQLRAWWYAEMISTPSPLTERMALFWHNHFVSAFEGVGQNVHRMWDQNAMFRAEAGGSFARLLQASLSDPVLLRYLDAHRNVKGRPNENLARELLELFTLGEGHYAEADIREIARALTGLGLDPASDWGFRFNHGSHDQGTKRFLGETGSGAADVVRVLLARERTAAFLASKLWREFGAPEPDAAAEAAIAAALRGSGWEIRPALRALFLSDAFWSTRNRGALVKSPVVLIVGAHRELGLPAVDLAALPVHGRRLGQDLFEPPNVKGWTGGTAWITPASLVARLDVMERLLANRQLVAGPELAGRRVLALRVAGDAWNGPPVMRLTINADRLVARREIEFATDTARQGTLPDRSDWNWRVLRFPVDEEVRVAKVEFLNDAAAPASDGPRRGDRNLYVEWLEVDGERFLAADAAQAWRGANCGPPRPGNLNCNGELVFDLAAMRHAGRMRPRDETEGMMAGMAAPSMGGGMSMAAPRAPAAALPPRPTHQDARAWLAALPAPLRRPDTAWRALAPLPPVGGMQGGAEAEALLRAIVFDPVYQLM